MAALGEETNIIEEHFSKTHSVHGLLLGLSEFWKSAPISV